MLHPVGGSFPVDFVITYFNPADEKARAAFQRRLSSVDQSQLPEGSTDSKRYTDAGELRYNLRGLEKNAGTWYRNIFIVVADDMDLPPWLDVNSPRLKIIRHRQIFNHGSDLPTFNSQAIEARIHHIPGLAEHFVYVNDDMFLYRPTVAQTFFTPAGAARVWPAGFHMPIYEWQDGHTLAVKNTLERLKPIIHKWPVDGDNTMNHQVKPLTRSMMQRAETAFPDVWRATASHPFRTKMDIWPIMFASVLCVEEGRCPRESPPSSYFKNIDEEMTPSKAASEVYRDQPVLVCFNNSNDKQAGELEAQLRALFPEKSKFEKW
jgi:hypothetical protein